MRCCRCWLQSQALFILHESASGYSLFEIKGLDEIGQATDKVQESVRCATGTLRLLGVVAPRRSSLHTGRRRQQQQGS